MRERDIAYAIFALGRFIDCRIEEGMDRKVLRKIKLADPLIPSKDFLAKCCFFLISF